MEAKSYEQMEAEFKEFYINTIKPNLSQFNSRRKEYKKRNDSNGRHLLEIVCLFIVICFTFCLFIISGIFNIELPFWLHILLYSYITLGIVYQFLRFLFFLSHIRKSKKSELGYGTDDDLKIRFMKPFLEIFTTDSDWTDGFKYKGELATKIENYRESNLFNTIPFPNFFDMIFLNYKGCKINAYEMNLSVACIFSTLFFILLITLPFLSVLILLPLIFIVNFIPIILWLLVPFILVIIIFALVKLCQYSPFRGIVVELEMNKKFRGHTFFLNKSLSSKKIPFNHKKYQNIKLESVDFMNKYDVFSTSQTEARYILTTAMIDRLNHLKLAFHANYIRGSFKDNKLILAIDTGKDMFAMGNDSKDSTVQTFRDLFNEIVSVMKIVDQLRLDEKTGL